MKEGLEIKYAVIFSSYYLIYVNNTRKFSINHFFYDVLVPIQCISVSWTLAAHLVFLSYVCYLQNPF